MRKDDLIRLRHVLDAAKDALGFAENKTRHALDGDRMLVLSVVSLSRSWVKPQPG